MTGKRGISDVEALQLVAGRAGIEIPPVIGSLFDKPVVQDQVIDKQDIEAVVLDFI